MDKSLRSVVEHSGGPLLVLGGPGTGKTYGLEQRYLKVAAEIGPHRCLYLCNNRRYSAEARDRLIWGLANIEASIEVPVYTWHALAYHLVSRYYPALGYRNAPVLLTGPEQWGAVRELLAAEDSRAWGEWADRLTERAFVDEVADFCLRAEQRMMASADLEALAEAKPGWAPVARFFDTYRSSLKQQSRLDYAGLVAASVELLAKEESIRGTLRKRFPHVLVDEAQELSNAHLRLLGQLESSSLVVAADPNSGIETFRGAEPDWVYGFEKWFGPHATITLAASHRIGEPACGAVARLTAHNDPDAKPMRPGTHATQMETRVHSSTEEEAEDIAREFRRLHISDGIPWNEMAVLISQPRRLLKSFERAFQHWEVPFEPMLGDRPLASEPAVGCFLDLVRFSLDAGGSQDHLPGLLTSGLGGMNYQHRRELERRAWIEGTTLRDVVEQAPETAELRRLRELVIDHQDLADNCFWQVYKNAGHYQQLESRAKSDPNDAANADLDALVAFSHSLQRYVERRHGRGSIGDYLNEAARADFGGDPWLSSNAADANAVAVLSFHGAKGRQWHTVAVAGCLDAWLPKGKRAQGLFDPFALETPGAAERQIEAVAQDRRTFYVAATRARSRSIFSAASSAANRTRPSRFLAELGEGLVNGQRTSESQPLTIGELAGRLRRTAASPASTAAQRLAGVIALSEIPGIDPNRWYGRWNWTSGSVPLVQGELRTSYSRLGVFQNCPLQYVLQSVLGLDPSSTHSMKFGTWIHALFQSVHEKRINDAAALRAEYEKLFDPKVFPNATIARQFHRDGEQMLEVFWKREAGASTVVAEHEFEVSYGGARLRGRIDRIDRCGKALKLVDYKTAKWALSKPEAEKSLQLAMYHLAARLDPELIELGEPQVAQLVYPGSLWPSGDHKVLSQNAEQADAVIEELPGMITRVLGEEFRPSPDADCHFCKLKPLCPLWPEGREVAT